MRRAEHALQSALNKTRSDKEMETRRADELERRVTELQHHEADVTSYVDHDAWRAVLCLFLFGFKGCVYA